MILILVNFINISLVTWLGSINHVVWFDRIVMEYE
jgi:hypothetical protein